MDIIIKETGASETLEIVDYRTKVNYVKDFIGNSGDLNNGIFVYDEEQDAYICEQDTFDWWEKVLYDHQEVDDRIKEMSDKYGDPTIQNVINKANVFADLEDQPDFINKALDEFLYRRSTL